MSNILPRNGPALFSDLSKLINIVDINPSVSYARVEVWWTCVAFFTTVLTLSHVGSNLLWQTHKVLSVYFPPTLTNFVLNLDNVIYLYNPCQI